MTAENKETIVTAKLAPVDATDQNVTWKIVDDAGIPVTFAEVVPDGLTAKVTAKVMGLSVCAACPVPVPEKYV